MQRGQENWHRGHIQAIRGKDRSAQTDTGRYRYGKGIELCVKNLATWCHELVHATDDRNGSLKEKGQHWRSETVAELGGAVLLEVLGCSASLVPSAGRLLLSSIFWCPVEPSGVSTDQNFKLVGEPYLDGFAGLDEKLLTLDHCSLVWLQ